MDGRELYEKYCEIMLRLNSCDNDSWDQLEDGDQVVWNQLALELPREG